MANRSTRRSVASYPPGVGTLAVRVVVLSIALLVGVLLGMELLGIAAQALPGPFYDPLCGRNCLPVIP